MLAIAQLLRSQPDSGVVRRFGVVGWLRFENFEELIRAARHHPVDLEKGVARRADETLDVGWDARARNV